MSPRPSLVVVGDLVVDRDLTGHVDRVCPDAPVPVLDVDRELTGPGAAGLTALLCARGPVDVTLVAPVADDDDGALVRSSVAAAGIRLVELAQHGPTRRKTRARSLGQSLLRIDEGGPATPSGPVPAAAEEAIATADVVLVSCYGGGVSEHPRVRALLEARSPRRAVLWDPHPRGGRPVPGCLLVTPNRAEAVAAAGGTAPSEELARDLAQRWRARSVCVTEGSAGAWLSTPPGDSIHVPTRPVDGDACGAGDAFVATVAMSMARGAATSEAVAEGVEAARQWVLDGGTSGYRRARLGGTPPSPLTPATTSGDAGVIERVRREGGTLVATGGCFDVLHAGHVACLEGARELGDALVALVNSDRSVQRLKGPGRPVNAVEDRVRILRALACVDDVLVFDESSPMTALDELRPDVWVKGGDYEGTELPETDRVRSWGGRVVLLPHLAGYSTTGLLADAR